MRTCAAVQSDALKSQNNHYQMKIESWKVIHAGPKTKKKKKEEESMTNIVMFTCAARGSNILASAYASL